MTPLIYPKIAIGQEHPQRHFRLSLSQEDRVALHKAGMLPVGHSVQALPYPPSVHHPHHRLHHCWSLLCRRLRLQARRAVHRWTLPRTIAGQPRLAGAAVLEVIGQSDS